MGEEEKRRKKISIFLIGYPIYKSAKILILTFLIIHLEYQKKFKNKLDELYIHQYKIKHLKKTYLKSENEKAKFNNK